MSIGIQFEEGTDERAKQEIYRKFLELLQNSNKVVRPITGYMGAELLGSIAKYGKIKDLSGYIQEKLDFVKAIREELKFENERLYHIKGGHRWDSENII